MKNHSFEVRERERARGWDGCKGANVIFIRLNNDTVIMGGVGESSFDQVEKLPR